MYYVTDRLGDLPLFMDARHNFTACRDNAKQFTADEAIAMQNSVTHHPAHRNARIEPVARNLADQLTAAQLSALAGMLGYKEAGCLFGGTLKKTPPLPHGFSMRDAALAYIDALRAGVVAAGPEVRT